MRRLFMAIVASIAIMVGLIAFWRRNPRIGSARLNRVVNPALLGRGVAGAGRSELCVLEHFGRHSGTRHLTPLHAVPTDDGFRIMVPLGLKSQWAQNVLAAGHCRMQLHDVVYELDEPRLLPAGAMPELSSLTRSVTGGLGFLHLRLHTFAEHPGMLEPEPAAEQPVEAGAPVAEPPIDATPATAPAELATAAAE